MAILDKISKLIQDTKEKQLEQIHNNQNSPEQLLDEATRVTVGNYTARRDQPHVQGDEYHAHVLVSGGEASWGKSGSRRHPNKFPSDIPQDAKNAAALVLKVDATKLE